MNDIKIFENKQFGKIRTAGTSKEPLFCAIDICKALQYTNNRRAIALHVEKEDVTKCYAPYEWWRTKVSLCYGKWLILTYFRVQVARSQSIQTLDYLKSITIYS